MRNVVPKYSYGQMKAGVLFAAERCLARGITNIHDIVTNNASIRAYQELVDEGTLPIRVSLLIRVIEAAIKKESLLNLGIKTGFGNDWLRIGGVKMSIDGGITGHVAKFYEPYVDDPCHEGLIRIEQDELDETVQRLSLRRASRLHPCHRRRRHGHGAALAREGDPGQSARRSPPPRGASRQLAGQ